MSIFLSFVGISTKISICVIRNLECKNRKISEAYVDLPPNYFAFMSDITMNRIQTHGRPERRERDNTTRWSSNSIGDADAEQRGRRGSADDEEGDVDYLRLLCQMSILSQSSTHTT